jgi:hypothetical protein
MVSISPDNLPFSDPNMTSMGRCGGCKPTKFKKKYVKVKTQGKKNTLGLGASQKPIEHPSAMNVIVPAISMLDPS